MQASRALFTVLLGVLLLGTISGCGSSGNGENEPETLVTVRGRVDDGTATSPIAHAACRFVHRRGRQLAATTADHSGTFRLTVPSDVEGFIVCSPPGFPNLALVTFVSTIGVSAGETIPATGFEEVSPSTSVVAGIITQTASADPQARKAELLVALAAHDPDLIMLTEAVTALFNAMLQEGITNVDFSTGSVEESGDGGGAGVDSGAGVGGAVGDGAEFSPLVGVLCEFVLHPMGDSAMEDLLADGLLDRPELQSIAADVAQDAAIQGAFARLFPHGVQPPDSNGRPLRITTNTNGRYFLHVPPRTPGFVRCAPTPHLAMSTFVAARREGETLINQHVSPPNQFFAEFLFPLLPQQDVQAVEDNFHNDIGDIALATHGIVRMETIESPQGRRIADTDDDGLVCSLRKDPQQAAIQYRAAAAAAFTATTLFNTLLIEAQNPAMSSYEDILADVLLRTTETGSPLLEILDTDLTAGGVPARRATGLATLLNRCIQAFVEVTLEIPLSRMVQAGRLRVTVRDEQGTLLPRAQATVEGAVILAAVSSNCESVGKQTVCRTDENGLVIIVLEGEKSLAVTPVLLIVESEDGALTSQMQVDFLPPSTRNIEVTVHPS